MQHWQRTARNQALTDKRKAAKQGSAIVEWMRRKSEDDKSKQESVSADGGVEAVPDRTAKDTWDAL